MKPFALFAHEDYYPGGGLRDLVGFFDTIEQAIQNVPESQYVDGYTNPRSNEACYIVDTRTWDIVWEGSEGRDLEPFTEHWGGGWITHYREKFLRPAQSGDPDGT